MERETPAQTAKAVFDHAHEIRSPAERQAYLDQACANAPALRQKWEALLQAFEAAGSSFLEKPAFPSAKTGPYRPANETPASSPSDSARTVDKQARMDTQIGNEGPGTQIGPYRLIDELGHGGMGVVWKAEQVEPIRRQVALKIIKSGMDSDHVIARFEAERQALTLMDHGNIARVLDAGATEKGLPYFVMELVKGVPLTKFCKENTLPLRQRLMLFASVCQAIQHAHQKGIIHRDLKPSNVLVALHDGQPMAKVIDFGLAKATEQPLTEHSQLTQIGAVMGTLEYMSPEQADPRGQGIDTRTDIYSLGVMLYELLTGTTPLDRATRREEGVIDVVRRITQEEPPRPSLRVQGLGERLAKIAAERKTEPGRLVKLLRGELDWIALKALEKDRDRRYETASGFAGDVQRYLDDEPVEACPPSARYRLGKFARKHRTLLSVTAGFVALLVLGVVGLTVGIVEVNKAKEREVHEKGKAVQARKAMASALRVSDGVVQVVARTQPRLGDSEKKALIRLLRSAGRLLPKPGDTQESRETAAETQRSLAHNFKFIGELAEAAAGYHRARQLYSALVEEFPQVVEYREALARINFDLAILLHQQGKLQEAEEAYGRAIPLHEQLVKDRPAEIVYRRDLADDYNNLGALLRDRKKLPQAVKVYQKAIALGEKLVREQPDHRVNLGASYHNLGNAVRDQGDPQAALAWYAKALKQLAPIKPPSEDVKLVLRNVSWDRANALGQLGRHAEASQDWQRAVDYEGKGTARVPLGRFLAASRMEEKLHAQTKPAAGLLYAAAVLDARAAAAAAAKGVDEPCLAKRYVERTLALLQQARAAGWFREPLRIQQLKKDRSFAVLPAADFQAFLATLGAAKGTKNPPEKR